MGNMGKLRHKVGRNGSRLDFGVVVQQAADSKLLVLLQPQFLGHVAGIVLFLLICYFLHEL